MKTIPISDITIEMVDVSAVNISKIGFSKEHLITAIEMLDGFLYYYLDTPEAEYIGLLKSESKGSYLQRNYKGKYRYVKIR